MKAGDTVRWRSDFKPNDRGPMLAYEIPDPGYVRLDGPKGSVVSEKLLELVESGPHPVVDAMRAVMEKNSGVCAALAASPVAHASDDGLMAVIDVQLAEIDRLAHDLEMARSTIRGLNAEADSMVAYRAGEDDGFRESTERMLGNLCIALGFDRRPLVKTGIHELDALVRYVME